MRWSKNIFEEREVPEQVLFPSMEEVIDPLLNLAIYLEVSRAAGVVLDKDGHLFGGSKCRHGMRRLFDVLVSDDDFQSLMSGLLGNHSVRKGAATFGMRSGLSRDHTNRRGRWRVRRQVVDVYIDPNLPYPDALAASKLCGQKGACKYTVRRNVEVSSSFILEKVVPECCRLLGNSAALPLGHALLWASFQDKNHPIQDCPLLPEWLRHKVLSHFQASYGEVEQLNVENPVQRLSVTPQGNGDQCTMIEIDLEDEDGPDGMYQAGTGNVLRSGEAPAALFAHQVQVQRQLEETKGQILQQLFEMKLQHRKQYHIISRNIKRIAIQPVVRPRLILQQERGEQDEQDETSLNDNEDKQNILLSACL